MDSIARGLLEKLLAAGNRFAAGVTSRRPSLTASQLAAYRSLPSLQSKSACEETLFAARSAGAIEVVRDRDNPDAGFIERVNLANVDVLARFLGEIPLAVQVEAAAKLLLEMAPEFPVIEQVLGKWRQAGKIRGLGPDSAEDWHDAVSTIRFARSRIEEDLTSLPIREASTKLFRDSKRIERLTTHADILLAGSTETKSRDASEVWQEIGLFREERPALLAGFVEIKRGRVTSLLDAPYGGFPADTVQQVCSKIDFVLSIENLTTFHSTAKRRCNEPVLFLYSGGMPSPSWRQMYRRLLTSIPESVPVFHWGDIDEGGFRIASVLATDTPATGHKLMPMFMHPEDIPKDQRVDASPKTVERMQHFARLAGWNDIADAIQTAKVMVEQEGL